MKRFCSFDWWCMFLRATRNEAKMEKKLRRRRNEASETTTFRVYYLMRLN